MVESSFQNFATPFSSLSFSKHLPPIYSKCCPCPLFSISSLSISKNPIFFQKSESYFFLCSKHQHPAKKNSIPLPQIHSFKPMFAYHRSIVCFRWFKFHLDGSYALCPGRVRIEGCVIKFSAPKQCRVNSFFLNFLSQNTPSHISLAHTL